MREQPSSSASPSPDPLPLLVAENVLFRGNGPYTFSVAGGECIGLCGESGVGKSQLLRAIADLIPWTGIVRLATVDSQAFPAPEWRRRVTMVPADPVWWYDLVGEHFPQDHPDLPALLAQVGFGPEVHDWEVTRLSSGEKQRLGLVRALLGGPQVLLLDEPTAALDGDNTARVEALLTALRLEQGLAMVMVSHDPGQLRRVASRIFVIERNGMRLLDS